MLMNTGEEGVVSEHGLFLFRDVQTSSLQVLLIRRKSEDDRVALLLAPFGSFAIRVLNDRVFSRSIDASNFRGLLDLGIAQP